MDYREVGKHYGARMTDSQKSKALEAKPEGKALISVDVGHKALLLTPAQFEQFKKGMQA